MNLFDLCCFISQIVCPIELFFSILCLLESTLDKQKYETDICKQVLKFLERDSIPWTEEENGTVLVIRVDVIDPRKMTFAKKSTARVR